MLSSAENITQVYGNKLRVRSCGILIINDEILLIKHKSINSTSVFWSPPGGGIDFGEHSKDALKREFLEETQLEISIKSFLFTYEYIKKPLHAIELYFEVEKIGGKLSLGSDPEMDHENQILIDLQFLSLADIKKMPFGNYHPIFNNLKKLKDILNYNSMFIEQKA